MKVIPAIDIIDGKCVRLSQGDFTRSVIYDESPVDVAKRFEDIGLKRLHMVDLEGAKRGTIANIRVLEAVASQTNLTIDFGGGAKTDEDVQAIFAAGAAMASIGSAAVKSPQRFASWLETFGPERFLLGADVKKGKLSVDGWQTITDLDVVPFLAEYRARGLTRAFVTDVSSDGMLEGPAIDLYRRILADLPELDLIASGGVRSVADLQELESIGCGGVIVGKALYENRISLKELSRYAG